MPTYEYLCDNCQYQFEKFQSITAKPSRKCPQCGKNSLKRLIGIGSGIIFKGSGFYETDYRSSEYKSAAKKEQSSSGGNGSSEKSEEKSQNTEKPKTASSDKSSTKTGSGSDTKAKD